MLLRGEADRSQHHGMRGRFAKPDILSELPIIVLYVLN
jgi:hypothetical protein